MSWLKKFAFLFLIPFVVVACGDDYEEEEEEEAPAPKSAKKKKKGKEPSETGKSIFIETCKEVYDGYFDAKGRVADKSIKLFNPSACSGEMLQMFYERRDANRQDSIQFSTDHVLYELSNNPQYWSKEKKEKLRKQQEEKLRAAQERIKQKQNQK